MTTADPEAAFAAIVDLAIQERWMVGTRLYPLAGDVDLPAVGARLAAFTGLGDVGFLDVMSVTEYDPPHRWVVRHDGAFVQGVGIFLVEAVDGRTRVTWIEDLQLPFGIIGRLGFPLVRPLARLGVWFSLQRLAREAEQLARRPVAG
ncbi:SRPBCC family protein [Nakamurella flava]|uniref:SRPBCC family protein n=1 Tax=Nakamurella flava TaxID=2576308 RepID=A0A4U6QKN8_9ACTN|nr:SRPBCC family protein [Nakamurella flava]